MNMEQPSKPITRRVLGGEYSSIILPPLRAGMSHLVETIFFGDDGTTVGPVRSTLPVRATIEGNIRELEIRMKGA